MEQMLNNKDNQKLSANMSDIYTKGFVIMNEKELLELIDLPDDIKFLHTEERLRDNEEKDLPMDVALRTRMASQFLKTKYIDPIWGKSEFVKYVMFDGVDKENQYWHTDSFEGMNVFFLFYFDDTFAETGGAIHFKWEGDKIHTHQPKKGDLIMVNCKRGFFHKADPTTIRRRVCSFDYQVEGPL